MYAGKSYQAVRNLGIAMEIVNDEYWLGYAKKSVSDAPTTINGAAAKLAALTATFWTIYTTAFAVSSVFQEWELTPTAIFLFISPIPLLILAHCLAVWVQLPTFSTQDIDPRIPKDVERFYIASVREKRNRLAWSAAVTFLAALSLTIALCLANFSKDKKKSKKRRDNVEMTIEKGTLVVTGALKTRSVVTIKVDSVTKDKTYMPYLADTVIVVNDSVFNHNVRLAGQSDTFLVTVSWKDNSKSTISRSITGTVAR